MNSLGETFKRWTCPSDRELTLRAKLRAGWSSRANNNDLTEPQGSSQPINEAEQAAILAVLERANKLQEQENERIRKLNERLDKLQKQASNRAAQNPATPSASSSWAKNCILCNEEPSFFRKFYTCSDCNQPVCKKCTVEETIPLGSASQAFWLCKICSEWREHLKKSNKWTQLSCGGGSDLPPQSQLA